MVPLDPMVIVAIVFAVLGLAFLLATIVALKKKRLLGTTTNLLLALLMISLSALSGTISIATLGYHSLTREELAATVKVEPTGAQEFTARFSMPDGSEMVFLLAGDQLYVDAHILKWKPITNILGLHTSYELDRVAGRYTMLKDEKTKARTVYSLSRDKPLNMFDLRRRFAVLGHLLDAEYGSATFINSNKTEEFNIMVSTSGLLIRKVAKVPACGIS